MKTQVRGYWRHDPRTGKLVFVKKHQREIPQRYRLSASHRPPPPIIPEEDIQRSPRKALRNVVYAWRDLVTAAMQADDMGGQEDEAFRGKKGRMAFVDLVAKNAMYLPDHPDVFYKNVFLSDIPDNLSEIDRAQFVMDRHKLLRSIERSTGNIGSHDQLIPSNYVFRLDDESAAKLIYELIKDAAWNIYEGGHKRAHEGDRYWRGMMDAAYSLVSYLGNVGLPTTVIREISTWANYHLSPDDDNDPYNRGQRDLIKKLSLVFSQ